MEKASAKFIIVVNNLNLKIVIITFVKSLDFYTGLLYREFESLD